MVQTCDLCVVLAEPLWHAYFNINQQRAFTAVHVMMSVLLLLAHATFAHHHSYVHSYRMGWGCAGRTVFSSARSGRQLTTKAAGQQGPQGQLTHGQCTAADPCRYISVGTAGTGGKGG